MYKMPELYGEINNRIECLHQISAQHIPESYPLSLEPCDLQSLKFKSSNAQR